MLKTYYLLTKPGIIMGNLITTVAGFFLASKGQLDLKLFLTTVVGIGCVIASACVFNNYIDRESDKKMTRTQNRPLAKGLIAEKKALIFAILLGIVGFAFLLIYTNLLAACMAALAFIVYVALYSFWKYRTSFATLVGSVSGAMPPVIGYTAVSGSIDAGAILLFLILVLWQMPHFFSIAMYRKEDYQAANIPVLPVKSGNQKTKIQMFLYILFFILVSLMLIPLKSVGLPYLYTMPILGAAWLLLGLLGFKTTIDDTAWARQMFRLSLVVIIGFCGLILI